MSTLNQLANLIGRMDADETVEAAGMIMSELSMDDAIRVIVALAKQDEILLDELMAHLEDA